MATKRNQYQRGGQRECEYIKQAAKSSNFTFHSKHENASLRRPRVRFMRELLRMLHMRQ